LNIPSDYKNLSTIAKASGKRLSNWVDQPVGKNAIAEFKLNRPQIQFPLITKEGKNGGTWAHSELAAVFAAWCNPQFAAEVVKQNELLREQNKLLKEKIKTFQVSTPAQIAAALIEVGEVKSLAYQAKKKGPEEIELLAKCHFVGGMGAHPKKLTFEQYFPHWLAAQGHRTDIHPADVVADLIARHGEPVPYKGKVLAHGYTYVWVDATS
jgi:hypothetical protein